MKRQYKIFGVLLLALILISVPVYAKIVYNTNSGVTHPIDGCKEVGVTTIGGVKLYYLRYTTGGKIYGGTSGNGHFFIYDICTGSFTDKGVAVSGQPHVPALTFGEDRMIYGGTGDSVKAHMFVFDPKTELITDKGETDLPDGDFITILTTVGNKIYGGTGWGNHFFIYDPILNTYVDKGGYGGVGDADIFASTKGLDGKVYFSDADPTSIEPILKSYNPATDSIAKEAELTGEFYIEALVTGCDGKIYGGTTKNAHFFIYNPSDGSLIDKGTIFPGEESIKSLTVGADCKIYGGTRDYNLVAPGGGGLFFVYDPHDGSIIKKGPLPTDVKNIDALTTGPDKKIYIGTANVAGSGTVHFFIYDPISGKIIDKGNPVSGATGILSLVA